MWSKVSRRYVSDDPELLSCAASRSTASKAQTASMLISHDSQRNK
jgi:hypothetical protein